jgi:hypothetical protein
MGEEKKPPASETEPAAIAEPPPFKPDPDLITFLERGAKPGQVKVWEPESGAAKPRKP